MNNIGEIEGNSVIRDEKIQDKKVNERYSDEDIVKLIADSNEYKSARDEHVMNNIFEIVTWDSYRYVSNITYNIKLVRAFCIGFRSGYDREKGNFVGSVKIEESKFFTRFVIEFVGNYKGLPDFYNETLSPYSDHKYFPTSDDDKDMLEARVNKMIYEVRDNIIPKYVDHINSEINRLIDSKEQCCRMFSVSKLE